MVVTFRATLICRTIENWFLTNNCNARDSEIQSAKIHLFVKNEVKNAYKSTVTCCSLCLDAVLFASKELASLC